MSNSPPDQFAPLQINPKTGEPFLRLREHENIILTPPRWEDAEALLPLFNDPAMYQWFVSPPVPYLKGPRACSSLKMVIILALEDGEKYIKWLKEPIDASIQKLKDAQGSETLLVADRCPIGVIREVDGERDRMIGNIQMTRTDLGQFVDTDSVNPEGKERIESENNQLPVGDPRIIWTSGSKLLSTAIVVALTSLSDYLSPSHHGKGITTDALRTLIYDWCIPRMNARRFLIATLDGNVASVRTYQKVGFTLTRVVPPHQIVKGKLRGNNILEMTVDG